jgi:hypothetical protein
MQNMACEVCGRLSTMEDRQVVPLLNQKAHDVCTDEAGGPDDEDPHLSGGAILVTVKTLDISPVIIEIHMREYPCRVHVMQPGSVTAL